MDRKRLEAFVAEINHPDLPPSTRLRTTRTLVRASRSLTWLFISERSGVAGLHDFFFFSSGKYIVHCTGTLPYICAILSFSSLMLEHIFCNPDNHPDMFHELSQTVLRTEPLVIILPVPWFRRIRFQPFCCISV
jgi:hypothetical protein